MINRLRLSIIVLLSLGCTAWLSAQSAVAQANDDSDLISFVMGNTEFLVLHELAHMLIREKDIPILGPEEYAADYLATIQLIQASRSQPDSESIITEFVVSAAEAFGLSWDLGTQYDAEIPYWGAHALSIQRYYSVVCLLYGSNPGEFEELLESAEIPESRSRSCEAEFQRADQSVQWISAAFGRKPGDPESAEVNILYDMPRTRLDAVLIEEIHSRQLFEQTVEAYREQFLIEESFDVVVTSCGQAQGAWLPEDRELIICYELLDAFVQFERMRH